MVSIYRIRQGWIRDYSISIDPVEIRALDTSIRLRVLRKYRQPMNNHFTPRTPSSACIFKHLAQLLKNTGKIMHRSRSIQVPRLVFH